MQVQTDMMPAVFWLQSSFPTWVDFQGYTAVMDDNDDDEHYDKYPRQYQQQINLLLHYSLT
jgi:hypothetical protein